MDDTTVCYVAQTPQGGWRIVDSRVSLDSVVHAWLAGRQPEAIADSLPSLSLEQIHGAIAFYLRHREDIDTYLADQDERWEELRQQCEAANGPLRRRIRARRDAYAAVGGDR